MVSEDIEPITVTGEKVDNEKALKLVRKEYGRESQFVVTSVKEEENVYSIDLDTFVANAKIIK